MANDVHKIKLLLLWDILCKNTDEDHALNTDEIISLLAEKKIAVSRKILLQAIALLHDVLLQFSLIHRRIITVSCKTIQFVNQNDIKLMVFTVCNHFLERWSMICCCTLRFIDIGFHN